METLIDGELETALQTVPHELTLQRDPDSEIEAATHAAKALKRVIDGRDDKVVIRGKTFLRYEDWQTVGQFYGYSVQTDSAEPCEIEGIKGAKAKAILLDRQGNLAGGAEAYCMRDEEKWLRSPWYQLASMAQTRAGAKALRNRLAWVAVLAGYSGTPAEEMDSDTRSYSEHREPSGDVPSCPQCEGPMWDNRATKKGRQPDFKCKDKTCNKAVWLDSDAGKLTPKEAAIAALMAQAEKLLPPTSTKLAALRGISDPDELGQKIQMLVDAAAKKKKAQATSDDPAEKERLALIDAIETAVSPDEIRRELTDSYGGRLLYELSLDQLVQLQADCVPF